MKKKINKNIKHEKASGGFKWRSCEDEQRCIPSACDVVTAPANHSDWPSTLIEAACT